MKEGVEWTRQYSDDVFLEDPLPSTHSRWARELVEGGEVTDTQSGGCGGSELGC